MKHLPIKRATLVALIFVAMSLTACAPGSSYRPIVDMSGKAAWEYEWDLNECQEYAKQVSTAGSAATGAVVGAGVTAGVGAIVGAFLGCPGEGAAMGAALGGFSGAAGGYGRGRGDQIAIIQRCMVGRNWSVLR
jgi:outer membrane lipoprotein SlyB